MEPRIALARNFVDYFARNPRYDYPAAGITKKDGAAVRDPLVLAQRNLRIAKVECVVRKRARDAAEQALRKKMRQAVVILGVSIPRGDDRWLDFGLNRPQPVRGGAERTDAAAHRGAGVAVAADEAAAA